MENGRDVSQELTTELTEKRLDKDAAAKG